MKIRIRQTRDPENSPDHLSRDHAVVRLLVHNQTSAPSSCVPFESVSPFGLHFPDLQTRHTRLLEPLQRP